MNPEQRNGGERKGMSADVYRQMLEVMMKRGGRCGEADG
jgi:hypothetical protein